MENKNETQNGAEIFNFAVCPMCSVPVSTRSIYLINIYRIIDTGREREYKNGGPTED